MVFSKPEGVRVTFFPCNIYVNSERTSQLKPWTTRELQDIEGFSAQNVSCLWYDFIPRDGDLKSGDFFSDQHPLPPDRIRQCGPPRKCLLEFWSSVQEGQRLALYPGDFRIIRESWHIWSHIFHNSLYHSILSVMLLFSPLAWKRDKHLILSYNITPESHIKVMWIREMITK